MFGHLLPAVTIIQQLSKYIEMISNFINLNNAMSWKSKTSKLSKVTATMQKYNTRVIIESYN